MQVQRCNSYQNNPRFGALYINPEQIGKVVGKRFAKEAIDATPRLKELAKDVDIEVCAKVSSYTPDDLELRGFKYCVSQITPPEPKIKNPIKRLFSRKPNKQNPLYVEGEMRFVNTSSDETVADYLVDCVRRAKDKFIKLGGWDYE